MSDRLDRFEMKFVLTPEQKEVLMPCLLPKLRPDGYGDAEGFYPIVSLYYDSFDRDCYWEKVRGQGSRRKLRVRVYGSRDGALPPTSFVEIKHKCDSRVVKRRVEMPTEAALAICDLQPVGLRLNFAEIRVIEEVQGLVALRGFRPVCCMRYDRRALADLDESSDLRITFDSGIGYRMSELTPQPDDNRFSEYLLTPGSVVMEVKGTGAVPYWLARLLGEMDCILTSFSKYCNALEAGDPYLRGLRESQQLWGCRSERTTESQVA